MAEDTRYEKFPGINPEFGVPMGEQASNHENDRATIIGQLEELIDALHSQMPLGQVAEVLQAVANQLNLEYIATLMPHKFKESLEQSEEVCQCDDGYMCARCEEDLMRPPSMNTWVINEDVMECEYCEGSYVCTTHSGIDGSPAYES